MRFTKIHFCISFLLVAVYSCDVLQTDTLPEPAPVSSVRLVTLAGGAVIFDLAEIVQPTSDATTSLAEAPRSGSLEPLGGNLFRYMPYQAVAGSDRVIFKTTFSSSRGHRTDTVRFEVKAPRNASDSLDLPCTIIAADDHASVPSAEPVQVNVLSNDFVCDAITLNTPPVTLLKLPAHGAVTMNNTGFVYTKNAGVDMVVDTVVYKVCGQGATAVCGIGIVYLQVGSFGGQCSWDAGDDFAEFGLTDTSGQLDIFVFANDTICDTGKIKSLTIGQQPQHGAAAVADVTAGHLVYELFDENFVGTDQFSYTVCNTDSQCFTASVTVSRPQCALAARDDHFYIVDSLHASSGVAIMEILYNDQLCGEDLTPVIIEGPHHGSASIDENNYLVYSDFSSLQHLDSLRYRLCNGQQVCSEARVLIEKAD